MWNNDTSGETSACAAFAEEAVANCLLELDCSVRPREWRLIMTSRTKEHTFGIPSSFGNSN